MDYLAVLTIALMLFLALQFVDFYKEEYLELLYSNREGEVKSVNMLYKHMGSEWTGIADIESYIEEQRYEEDVKILWLNVRWSRWRAVRRM